MRKGSFGESLNLLFEIREGRTSLVLGGNLPEEALRFESDDDLGKPEGPAMWFSSFAIECFKRKNMLGNVKGRSS